MNIGSKTKYQIAACVSPLTFTQVQAGMKEPFEKTGFPPSRE